jgi:NADH-quinone oxidoreductase subunit A
VNPPASQFPTLWPLAVYFGAVIVLAGTMIGLSYLLGEHHRDGATGTPYESGIMTTGSAQIRLSVKFYLVAMFFVVFDLEAVFIFAWAVALREVGWAGYIEALIFIAILAATLAYLWREGALDWGPAPARQLARGSLRVRTNDRTVTLERKQALPEIRPLPTKDG